MNKRLRLKKQVIIIPIIFLLIGIGIYYGLKKYEQYKYEQTYEYKLFAHGYTMDEVDIILDEFTSENDLTYLLENDVNSNYVLLTQEKYYMYKNYYSYIDYMNENTDLSLEEVVRNINIHLDNEFYEANLVTDTSKDTLMLVNKFYILDSSYEPTDLVTISTTYAWGDSGSQQVREVAYNAFLDMWNAAYEDGYYLMVSSSYRTYAEQEIVYNNYKTTYGTKYADGIAARPGSSEHQTGLTLDIFSKTNSNRNTFHESEAAKWLVENSYKYGFILRYPEDKIDITGYNYEAWHFRYVGIEVATYIYENNITFEEYYAYFIE